ncbi:MAG: hypothetical protein RR334_02550 [Clostridia bacterium]
MIRRIFFYIGTLIYIIGIALTITLMFFIGKYFVANGNLTNDTWVINNPSKITAEQSNKNKANDSIMSILPWQSGMVLVSSVIFFTTVSFKNATKRT